MKKKLVILAIVALLFAPVMVSAQETIIPYLDTDYKYKVVAFGGEAGFEALSYDDSAWSTGDAGFGSIGGCDLNNATYIKTDWALGTDILLRKEFNLPAGATNLNVGVAIDNDVQVFLNGQDISGGLRIHDGCPSRDSFVFSAPDGILEAGTNLLAVRGHDRGGSSYLDVQVTADVSRVIEVSLDIKPQSCPNPVNFSGRGVTPVAVLGASDFDVAAIDPATVRLAGIAPIRSNIEDVSRPIAHREGECACTTEGPDGYADLTLKFDTQQLASALGAVADGETIELSLTGNLYDGTSIKGKDCIKCLVKKTSR